MASSRAWAKIAKDHGILQHDFTKAPFHVSATDIKKSVQRFKTTGEKEVRVLCKQDTREQRPDIFKKNELFILPTKNGRFAIIKGEGYIDIPEILGEPQDYSSKLDFDLETSKIGDSEMQHLDFAYAVSIIRTFVGDPSLILTIRGRKYTPKFEFFVGKQKIDTSSVQTEIDAGYEGKDRIILIEAKNRGDKNVIIRQLYYPFRQWQEHTKKPVTTLFFERTKDNIYSIWEFAFTNPTDYNSIKLVKAAKYKIK
jgi:hypothetical protein